jgi:hypothetical protein
MRRDFSAVACLVCLLKPSTGFVESFENRLNWLTRALQRIRNLSVSDSMRMDVEVAWLAKNCPISFVERRMILESSEGRSDFVREALIFVLFKQTIHEKKLNRRNFIRLVRPAVLSGGVESSMTALWDIDQLDSSEAKVLAEWVIETDRRDELAYRCCHLIQNKFGKSVLIPLYRDRLTWRLFDLAMKSTDLVSMRQFVSYGIRQKLIESKEITSYEDQLTALGHGDWVAGIFD